MIPHKLALFPFLLLISNTLASTKFRDARSTFGSIAGSELPNLYRREVTEEEMKRFEEYLTEPPSECQKRCDVGDVNTAAYIPLCSLSDGNPDRSEEDRLKDLENTYSCICADRKFVEIGISCLIKECGGNSTDLHGGLGSLYSTCMLYADIVFPKPETFLDELCLLDDVPEGSVPTDIPVMTKIWPEYTYAEDWPEQTATTWVPSASADLEEMFKESVGNRDIDTDSTFTCDGETKTSKGNGAASGRKGLAWMTAVVAIVGGIAVYL